MSRHPDAPSGPAAPDHGEDHADQAYLLAVGALPAAEEIAYRRHLEGCALCRAVFAEAAAAAAWLADLAPERDASPALKPRLMAAVRADRDEPGTGGGLAPAGRGPSAPDSAAAESRRVDPAASLQIRRLRERSGRWPALALAAALVIALAGLGIWDVRLSGETSRLRQQTGMQTAALQAIGGGATVVRLAPESRLPGGRASLVRGQPGSPSYLILDALPDLPANQVYQAWRIEGSRPVSAGVLPRGAGPAVIELTADLAGTTALALSVETAPGGRPAPGGPVVWVAPVA